MTDTEPLDLDPIEARHAEYRSVHCLPGDYIRCAAQPVADDVPALAAEIRQLRADLAGMAGLRDRAIAKQDTLRAELEQARTEAARREQLIEGARCRLHHIEAYVQKITDKDSPVGIGLDLMPWLDGPLHPDDYAAYQAVRTTQES